MYKRHLFPAFIALIMGVSLHQCKQLQIKPHEAKKKSTEPESYARKLTLTEDDSYVLEWTHSEDDVIFKVTAKTLGWVGLGFSPSGGMRGADVAIGWVQNGKAYLTDRFATANEQPQLDEQQDYELLRGTEENASTTLVFRRKLNTSDCKDMVLNTGTTRLLWSYHQDDPSGTDGPAYHGPNSRGTRSVFLLAEDHSKVRSLPPDAQTHEFLNNNVRPPKQLQTLYWCSIFQFPKLESRQHIVRYEPVITQGHEAFVHHIIVYACHAPPQDEQIFSFSDICLNLPKDIQNCIPIVFFWAIGGGPFDFPEHVGYSFGGPGDPLFVRMEVHYDNPRLPDKNFQDSSGIRFYYTPTLRQHNAGIFLAGVFPMWWHIIPPEQKEYRSEGWCLEECTKLYFPPEGIKLFAAMAHTHITGQKFKFRQFRNGKLIDDIINEENFDCDFQEIQLFEREKTILPGDVLQTECTSKTADRTNITYGGLGRTDEMCLSIPFYYPKIDDFGDCLSVSQPLDLLNRLGYENASNLPVEMDQFSTKQAFESFNWKDSKFVSEFRKAVSESNLYFRCDNETRLEQLNPFAEWKIPQVQRPIKDDLGKC